MSNQTHTNDSETPRAVMVGCGKMGGAMLSRWTAGGLADFTVVDPAGNGPDGVRQVASPDEIAAERFEVLIAAIKPQVLDDALPIYKDLLTDDAVAISIAAGVPAARVSKALGGVPVIRVMPNLPAAVGKGVSALFAGDGVTETHKNLATAMIEATGTAVWLGDEDLIDRFTAVAGSGPGYVFEMMRSYVEAAKALGFDDETARTLVLGTVAGTAEMAARDNRPLDELRNDVTSPNGTTQAGLDALRHEGALDDLLRRTVQDAYDRAVELR